MRGEVPRQSRVVISGVVQAMLVIPMGRPVFLSECLKPSSEPRAGLFQGCHGDLLRSVFPKITLVSTMLARSDRCHKFSLFSKQRPGRKYPKKPAVLFANPRGLNPGPHDQKCHVIGQRGPICCWLRTGLIAKSAALLGIIALSRDFSTRPHCWCCSGGTS